MKTRIFALLMLLPLNSFSGVWDDISKSSFTATNDTNANIPGVKPGDVLAGIVVSSSTPGGNIVLFDSSGTATGKIGSVSMASAGNGGFSVDFNVRISSSITYTTTGNTNGVAILWKPYMPRP